MQLDLEGMLGRARSIARPAPPEAYDQAQRNAEIARKRAELAGRITAEISAADLAAPRWYALTIAPGHERIAAAHLAGRRFGIYLPTIHETVWSAHAWRLRQQAIMPGYLFVSSLGLTGRWGRAKACPGVTGFVVRTGTDQPAPIPQRFIDELRAYEASENARFEVIHGRAPDAPKKKSRKARGGYKIRRGAHGTKRSP
jgi:transcription antitermination factor NusG